MKKALTRGFWSFSNFYGSLFGHAWLAGFHRVILTLSLHGLGYDNAAGYAASGEKRFIRSVLKKADIQVALDIGANTGKYATELVETLGCDVYAFEPSTRTFEGLTQTAGVHPKIHPIHLAVSDTDGTATIYSSDGHSETASLDAALHYQPEHSETVPTCTVDSFVKDRALARLDFIKIDTEGFEREVLRGMQETLKTLRPKYIQFEFNVLQLYRGYTLRQLTELLPGYYFYRLIPHGWLRVNPDRFRDNIFMYSNYVAVRA